MKNKEEREMFRVFSYGFIIGTFLGLFIDAYLAHKQGGWTWQWWNFAISPFIFTAWGLIFMAVKYVWSKFRGSS